MKRLAFVVLAACGAPQGPPPPPKPAPAPVKPSGPTWIGVFFDPGGATVGQVIPGSPAESAGIQAGDRFETVGGVRVQTGKDVTQIVQLTPEHTTLVAKIVRDGKSIEKPIVVDLRPVIDELATKLEGRQAPAIQLPKLGGGTFSLADARGHVVVLDFWATWCGPCLAQMPILIELQHRHPDVVVVGVNADDDAALHEVLGDKIPYTIARDEEQTSWRQYFVTALPTTFVVDEAGVIRHVELGLGDPAAIENAIASLRSRPSP